MAEFDYKEYARQMRENCVKDCNGNIVCSDELWEQIASIVENIPTADVEEVKHGEWTLTNPNFAVYKCSRCGEFPSDLSNFCPNCGAKMDVSKMEITTPKERGADNG